MEHIKYVKPAQHKVNSNIKFSLQRQLSIRLRV
jgi:hypothetical protein